MLRGLICTVVAVAATAASAYAQEQPPGQVWELGAIGGVGVIRPV